MAQPQTPAEWLPALAKALDDEQPRIQLLKRYAENNPRLPEMGKNLRASWERFQRKSKLALAPVIVDSVVDRMVPNGIEVGGSTTSETAKRYDKIWRDNRLDVVFKDFARYMATYRTAYFIAWTKDDEQPPRAAITAESPEYVYAATDPLWPWIVRAAIKVWRDDDAEMDYCFVWMPGQRQKFQRPSYTLDRRRRKRLNRRANDGAWQPVGNPVPYEGDVPVYPGENPAGAGEFELHIDLIDEIMLSRLQRLVTTAMQAFRQRALRPKDKEGEGLPDKDPDGNDIDWAKVLEPAPGALWDLPVPIDIWESQTTDITPMLNAEKDDLRNLASVSKTPLPALLPDSQNQAASGVDAAMQALIFKVRDRIAVAQIVLAAVLLKAGRIEEFEPEDDATIKVLFEPPDRVTLTEKFAAAASAKGVGLARRTIMRDVIGMSADQITQDEADLAVEQMAALTLASTAASQGAATEASISTMKARADAMKVLIDSGVEAQVAATQVGLTGLAFAQSEPAGG